MRRMVTAQLRVLIVLATTTGSGVLPWDGDTARAAPACPDSADPEMAPSLIDLREVLGDVMGSPSECPLIDADGNTVQVTTTGLAVHRPGGLSIFVSGEQHWALTAQGLETWIGNWHTGLYPPVSPPPDQVEWEPAQPALASIEPMTLVQVSQDGSNTVVLEDSAGSTFMVETAGGCPDVAAAVGDYVFMRSGGPQTDLILVRQQETCAIANIHAATAN